MRTHIKILVGIALSLFFAQSYAIQVSVQSSSSQVSALGFTTNGKDHGSAGKSYRGTNMPAGIYTFGVRVNGLFGTDVPCATSSGQKAVKLNKDTTATLTYDGNRCTMRLSSR